MTPLVLDALAEEDVSSVRRLVGDATVADGVAPLNEAALLRLTAPGSARHVLVRAGAELAAYAQLDIAGTGELVVHPAARRRGLGAKVLTTLLEVHTRPATLWAHGDLPGAAVLARSYGLRRSRELWQLRRPLDEPLPAVHWPDGVTVRTYAPGRDDVAWLELNAAAFASHPEQGRTTQADLDDRTRADWFDPAGFFLAEQGGDLVGFHWTKVHSGPTAIGEVYVIGVAPTAQGGGLGRALTLHGLQHLREAGLPAVILYVEADNAAAISVYERLGFTRAATDVAYTAD